MEVASGKAREVLAGRADLVAFEMLPTAIAVCEDAAEELIRAAWPGAVVERVAAPTAADALDLAAPKIRAGAFVDLALLDGHYLRRSDAEIFGDPVQALAQRT
jgi:tRNA threonylcarbamoyladenosine biosynthesis protein TsaB